MQPFHGLVNLNKVFRSEVSPQVNNLPSTEPNKHTHGPESEPLNTLIGALIGITQTLLTGTQVLHLGNDIGNHLFDAAEVCLDGLELLLRLDAVPVAGVGANVDIKFDGTGGVLDGIVADKQVLEADVKSRVRGRSEDLTRLADDILRATVIIAHSVLDMNIDLLAITLRTTNDSSDNDELVLRDEVANASLVLAAAGGGDEVEF